MYIPEKVLPVILILRSDVKRPNVSMIEFRQSAICTRVPRIIVGYTPYCPMGLHPKASWPTPANKDHLLVEGITNENIFSFVLWWDESVSLAEAREKFNLIWPLEGGKMKYTGLPEETLLYYVWSADGGRGGHGYPTIKEAQSYVTSSTHYRVIAEETTYRELNQIELGTIKQYLVDNAMKKLTDEEAKVLGLTK
jgi:hypothetical protein